MRFFTLAVFATCCCSFFVATVSKADVLYGVTAPDANGDATLIAINPSNAAPTVLFSFRLSTSFTSAQSLAYDPAGQFVYSSSSLTNGGRIAIINPITRSAVEHAITGLPSNQQSTGGVEYDSGLNSLVLTFGPSGSVNQNRIAKIDGSGNVTATSPALAIADGDHLAFNQSNSKLAIVDLNNAGGLGVSYVDDPFGTPSLTQIAPNPVDSAACDGAFNQAGDLFYPSGLTGGTSRLRKLQGGSFVDIGSFGLTQPVIGIAFAPIIPGDYDLNGIVDAADYVVWRKNPRGIYTEDDYNVWVNNFGNTVDGGGTGANAVVPEPTICLMLAVGLLAMIVAGASNTNRARRQLQAPDVNESSSVRDLIYSRSTVANGARFVRSARQRRTEMSRLIESLYAPSDRQASDRARR